VENEAAAEREAIRHRERVSNTMLNDLKKKKQKGQGTVLEKRCLDVDVSRVSKSGEDVGVTAGLGERSRWCA
jgi:hypothetical protein